MGDVEVTAYGVNERLNWCTTRPGGNVAPHDYRFDIDGLRAVAVILVVLSHAFASLLPGGFIGVDVFFVISGFLITNQILSEQTQYRFSIVSFYRRRVRRILPALILVMCATLVFGWLTLPPLSYERLGREVLAAALFAPNFLFWSEIGYFDARAISKPLLHLWSLGVEEQFYLIWPLILIVARKLRHRPFGALALLTAMSLVYSSIAAFSDPAAAFYSPLSRLWELGVGALLAVRPITLHRGIQFTSLAGLTAIVGSALLISEKTPFPGVFAILPVLGTAAILVAPSHLLSWRPLREIGLVSYPLYLWHWPLLSFAATEFFYSAPQRAVVVGASLLLAWLTTRFVEYPFRFGKWKLQAPAISIGALCATALIGAAVLFSAGVPLRFPLEIRPVLASMDYLDDHILDQARSGRCWIASDAPFDKYAPECRIGQTLIWGDSYSAFLGTGLPKPYAQFSRDGCLPIVRDTADQCAVSNRAILAQILKHPPKRVILFGAWLVEPNGQNVRSLNDGLRATLQSLRGRGIDVELVGPSPWWPPSLPQVVYRIWKASGRFPDRVQIDQSGLRAGDRDFRSMAREQNVGYLSVFDVLCNDDGCMTHTDHSRSELLAWDHGHLTIEGARFLTNRLGLR